MSGRLTRSDREALIASAASHEGTAQQWALSIGESVDAEGIAAAKAACSTAHALTAIALRLAAAQDFDGGLRVTPTRAFS